jgi:UDPglucose 6-dehydrogenase
MKIGIVGLGIVGSAVRMGFERLGHHVLVHDTKLSTSLGDVLPAEIIYVSVPTPSKNDGRCDIAIVEDVVSELAHHEYPGVVAIKSTVEPGTTDMLGLRHPKLHISFVPEFLRERVALADFTENHDVCIVGTHHDHIFEKIKVSHGKYPKQFVQLTPREAELAKYFNNIYNATLITFANSFYDICTHFGANYTTIKDALVSREHIIDRYLDCNEHFRGFGGVCLPKDLDALIALGKDNGVDVSFFESIKDQNGKYHITVPNGMRLGHDGLRNEH